MSNEILLKPISKTQRDELAASDIVDKILCGEEFSTTTESLFASGEYGKNFRNGRRRGVVMKVCARLIESGHRDLAEELLAAPDICSQKWVHEAKISLGLIPDPTPDKESFTYVWRAGVVRWGKNGQYRPAQDGLMKYLQGGDVSKYLLRAWALQLGRLAPARIAKSKIFMSEQDSAASEIGQWMSAGEDARSVMQAQTHEISKGVVAAKAKKPTLALKSLINRMKNGHSIELSDLQKEFVARSMKVKAEISQYETLQDSYEKGDFKFDDSQELAAYLSKQYPLETDTCAGLSQRVQQQFAASGIPHRPDQVCFYARNNNGGRPSYIKIEEPVKKGEYYIYRLNLKRQIRRVPGYPYEKGENFDIEVKTHKPFPVGAEILGYTLGKNRLDEYYISVQLSRLIPKKPAVQLLLSSKMIVMSWDPGAAVDNELVSDEYLSNLRVGAMRVFVTDGPDDGYLDRRDVTEQVSALIPAEQRYLGAFSTRAPLKIGERIKALKEMQATISEMELKGAGKELVRLRGLFAGLSRAQAKAVKSWQRETAAIRVKALRKYSDQSGNLPIVFVTEGTRSKEGFSFSTKGWRGENIHKLAPSTMFGYQHLECIEHGIPTVLVDRNGTSKVEYSSGNVVELQRGTRHNQVPGGGVYFHRDENAALMIVAKFVGSGRENVGWKVRARGDVVTAAWQALYGDKAAKKLHYPAASWEASEAAKEKLGIARAA